MNLSKHGASLVLALLCACAGPKAAAPPAPAAPVAPPPERAAPVAEAPAPQRITPDAEFRNQRPGPGTERPFQVPTVKRFKLKNGLQVILAEEHTLPLVGVELVVKTGNAANPRGQAGLADLTADLLDEGTKTRTALQIADEISFLGATLGTNAGWDATSIAVSGLRENLDQALQIWADVLLNPTFDEGEFERVQKNLLTALKRRKDSPPAIAGLTFSRVLYGENHPYGWPSTGTEETVQKISPPDLRRFHETYYRPNNAVLVVAGDITEAEVRAKIEPLLATWKARPTPKVALPRPRGGKTRIYLVDKAGAPQSSIRVGLVGIERTNADYHKALVMNHILGGSFKRLGLNLREAKGWTYGVSSVFEARRTPGPWLAGGEFVGDKTADSVAELLREVKLLRDTPVDDKELQETKDEIIKAFPARFATVNQIAGQMAALAVYGLPESELANFTKKIAAVTPAQVQAMARKYLRPDSMAIVVVGDQKSHEAALRKIGEVELRDLEGGPVGPGTAAK